MSFTDPNMEYWNNKTKIYSASAYLFIVMIPDLFISQGSTQWVSGDGIVKVMVLFVMYLHT